MSKQGPRYDRTLAAVMWMDAFLSAALAVVCLVASPIVALAGLPHWMLTDLGIAALVLCGLLAAFGAITFVLIWLRMRAGHYWLPAGLRLPLPASMRPPMDP